MAKGRMLRKTISQSQKIAALSRESLILFFMIIPHLNSFGKQNGSPHYVKGEIVPLINWFTIPLIEKCLKEINEKTNLKWFSFNGLWWLHAVNWEKHQDMQKSRRGHDDLPNFRQLIEDSKTTPRVVRPELEVELEVEVKEEDPPTPLKGDACFLEFWENYPARNGKKLEKAETHKRFKKLSSADQQACLAAAGHYAASKLVLDGIGIKDPKRFIRNGGGTEPWRDWIDPETVEADDGGIAEVKRILAAQGFTDGA